MVGEKLKAPQPPVEAFHRAGVPVGAMVGAKKSKKYETFKKPRNVMKMYIMIICVYVRVFARRKLNFMRSSGGEHHLSGPQRRPLGLQAAFP